MTEHQHPGMALGKQSNGNAVSAKNSVTVFMAERYGMEPRAFEATVLATCSPSGRPLTREEFAAFLLVAKEYRLSPITREIYAFPKRGGGVVPIVGIDGWVSLVNSHPQFDGMEFVEGHDDKGNLVSCTCRLYRKDRSRPVEVTEYFDECKRNTDPWKMMKHRMLRHKAMIQCARYAFGFSGIYDEEEGAVIAEARDITPPPPPPPSPPESPPKRPRGRPRKITQEHHGAHHVDESAKKTAEKHETISDNGGNTGGAHHVDDYPELPKELDRRNNAVEAEVVEEPLQMFTAPELQAYLDDLESRYAQAPDRESIEEIRAEAEEAKGKMFPFDAAKVDALYGRALER